MNVRMNLSRPVAVTLWTLALLVLAFAGTARAATDVVTFDDLAAGTQVSQQYESVDGIEFPGTPNGGPGGPDGFLPTVAAAPSQAHSSPNVANIYGCQECGEFNYAPHTRAYLTEYASAVSVYVGEIANTQFPAGDTAIVDLTAYDAGGDTVGTATAQVANGQPFKQISVTSTQDNIAYFDLSAPALADEDKPIGVDDITLIRPDTPQPPDFSIDTDGNGEELVAGDATSFGVAIHRVNGSNGKITLSTTGAPSGMTVTYTPNPVSGAGPDQSATANVTTTTATPSGDDTLTVTATPDAGSGSSVRTQTIPVEITQNCDHDAFAAYMIVHTVACMTRQADGTDIAYNTTVEVNGLILTPLTNAGAGSNLTINTANRTIVGVGNWEVSVAGVPGGSDIGIYTGPIKWNLANAVNTPGWNSGDPIIVVDSDITDNGAVGHPGGSLTFEGLPIAHTKIAMTSNGGAQVTPTLSFGFWPFNYLGSLTASTQFNTSNLSGPQFGGIEIKFDSIQALGFGLKDVDFKYTSQNTWQGSATLVLPFTPPFGVTIGVGLQDGSLSDFKGGVTGLNTPIGGGIFLQSIAFESGGQPPLLDGTLGFSAGPEVAGKAAVTFDGTLKYTFGDPWAIEVDGDAKVGGEFSLANAYARYISTGTFEFGGAVNWDLGVGSINGSIGGWIEGTQAFDVEGSVSGCINLWITSACASANALVSNIGIAACVNLDIASGGIGYYWGGSASLFSGCDLSPWRPTLSAAALFNAGSTKKVTLPSGLPSAVFAVDGDFGPPGVRVRGPGGVSVSASRARPDVRHGNALVLLSKGGTTFVVIKHPAAGVYSITNQGPVARDVREAYGLPAPFVRASVTGRGERQVLHWALRPIPGQTVQFSEQSSDVRHLITTTAAASGSVAFTPQAGPRGRRQIVAVVEQYKLPRATVVCQPLLGARATVTCQGDAREDHATRHHAGGQLARAAREVLLRGVRDDQRRTSSGVHDQTVGAVGDHPERHCRAGSDRSDQRPDPGQHPHRDRDRVTARVSRNDPTSVAGVGRPPAGGESRAPATRICVIPLPIVSER